jgi:hypothetical protein
MPVILHALSGLARSGATRSGYHTAAPFVGVAGLPARLNVEWKSLTITQRLNEAPDSCAFLAFGMRPVVGLEVVVTLGTTNGPRIFGGHIIKVAQSYVGTEVATSYQVDCVDYTWLLGKRFVTKTYRDMSASDIIRDLIATFATGFTATAVEDDLDVIDEITFSKDELPNAISKVAKRVNAQWYTDYYRDLHFWTGTESGVQQPTSLTSAHPSLEAVTMDTDLTQEVTRAIVQGGGGSALAAIPAGNTTLPVSVGTWYQEGGGEVIVGGRILSYTARELGGGGSLVGSGASPSGAPVLELATTGGAGVDTGAHDYAVSFVTAAGETIPGPIASITTGPIDPPSAPTIDTPTIGGSVDSGEHFYALTYRNGADETTPSALTSVTTGAVLPSGVVTPPTPAPSAANFDAATPFFSIGDVISVSVTYRNAAGETTAGASSSVTLIESVVTPGLAQSANVTGIPVSADPSVTSKRVYIKRNGTYVGHENLSAAAVSALISGTGNPSPAVPPFTNTAATTGTANTVHLRRGRDAPHLAHEGGIQRSAPRDGTVRGHGRVHRHRIGCVLVGHARAKLEHARRERRCAFRHSGWPVRYGHQEPLSHRGRRVAVEAAREHPELDRAVV